MCSFPTQWALLSNNTASTKSKFSFRYSSFYLLFLIWNLLTLPLFFLQHCLSQGRHLLIFFSLSSLSVYHFKFLSQNSQSTKEKSHVEFSLRAQCHPHGVPSINVYWKQGEKKKCQIVDELKIDHSKVIQPVCRSKTTSFCTCFANMTIAFMTKVYPTQSF